jgi:membrane-bound lytic murein transglycosylase D
MRFLWFTKAMQRNHEKGMFPMIASGWSRFAASLIVPLILVGFWGCETLSSYERAGSATKPDEQKKAGNPPPVLSPETTTSDTAVNGNDPSSPGDNGPVSSSSAADAGETGEAKDGGTKDSEETTNEELLESALEDCDTANALWERGDLDGAIEALDKAYAMILKADGSDDPNLLQQKEDLRLTISKRIVEVYASRYTVATGIGKAIPLAMNKYVMREIESFKTRERDFFMNAYRRSGRYRPAIVKALKEAGFPEELSWLPLIESGYKIRAQSSARALGMWQFIASTGYRFGLKRDSWIDERMDMEKSTRAAIAYLRELHQIFGDWTTALAAYNCGEYAVLSSIKRQKINYMDNFWDLFEKLPRETATYVPRFMAVLHIVNNPSAFGMDLPQPDKEIKSDEVMVNKQVELKTIADALDVPREELEEMNAELRQNVTPESPYSLKIPAGKGELLVAKLDAIPAWCPPAIVYRIHRVRRGESVSVIAARYRANPQDIIALNRLRKDGRLRIGMRLRIPVRAASSGSRVKAASASRLEGKEKAIKYEVKQGDSLFEIANRYNTTVKDIQSYNGLRSTNLQLGQVLLIHPEVDESCLPFKTKTYTVKEGDSPFLIARRYQMNLVDFLRINHLTNRSLIFPGQEVLVTAN